jgi:hypothetical protein
MANYFRTLCSRFGSAWTRFWFTPSDPIVLSLIRVLVGLVAIWWYLGYYTDLQAWLGPNGLFPLEMTQQMRTDETGTQHFAFSILDYVGSASELWFVYGLGLAALVLMTLGIFTRASTIASLVFVLSFIHRGPILARPADDILVMLLFYLCIGPSGANFSIDARLRERRQRSAFPQSAALPPMVRLSSAATVATRLMQIHLCLIYAATVVAQLQVETWWQGTAVWWLMARPDSRLVDLTALSRMGLTFEYFVNFCTHAVVLYEICFALLAWNSLARPILLVLGLFVWTGIALVGGAVTFAVAMLIANLAFLRPETLRACCAKETAQTNATAA